MGEKANILVLGTSGAGKSTLINTVIGSEVARVSHGRAGTEDMHMYTSDDLNFTLIDSRGFELDKKRTHKAVSDMKNWLKKGLKDEVNRIHMLWLCVDATSKRFTKHDIKLMETVKKEWHEAPIIVVLTKSFFEQEDEDNIRMVENTFELFAKKTGHPIAIIPVLSQAPKGEDKLPRGIEELIKTTEENMDEAVRASDEAVQQYVLKCKRIKSQMLTAGATAAGTVVGGVPIPVGDAAILTPMETGLITGIARIYEQDKDDDTVKKLMGRIIEVGTVSIIAKAAIGKLKAIPGLAGVAADVLNAIVAGGIVLGIGEASSIIMEKAYLGKIDAENLDWVDKVVESSMGDIIAKITNIVSNMKGDIDFKQILTVFLKPEGKKS